MALVGIAWRNLGRNRRRTILSVLAVAIAVALLLFSMSFQQGSYAAMIRNMVFAHAGNLQVQHRKYLNERDLAYHLHLPAGLLEELGALPHVLGVAPRVEAPCLASRGQHTFGALLMGIDPARERHTSKLALVVKDGRYLEPGETGAALLGQLLAHNLDASLGDEVVFLGQGAQGGVAAGRLAVRGLFSFGSGDFDRTALAAPLPEVQAAFSLPDAVTAIALRLDEDRARPAVAAAVRALLAKHGLEDAVVREWPELMPGVEQSIRIDWSSGLILYGVLTLVVAFGIGNTFLMAFMERTREFGVLLSLGMRPLQLARLVYAESVCLIAVGLAAGVALGAAATGWLQAHGIRLGESEMLTRYGMDPVIHPHLAPQAFAWAVGLVLVLSLLVALYPAAKAARLKPVEALRHA